MHDLFTHGLHLIILFTHHLCPFFFLTFVFLVVILQPHVVPHKHIHCTPRRCYSTIRTYQKENKSSQNSISNVKTMKSIARRKLRPLIFSCRLVDNKLPRKPEVHLKFHHKTTICGNASSLTK